QSPCSHHGAAAHPGAVQQDGAHADQGFVLYDGTADDGRVADGHPLAYFHRIPFVGVDDHAVLDVAVFADADGLDVAPQDGAEPDADAVGQCHIPHDLRIVCDKDASPHHRLAAAKGTDHAAAPSLIDKKRLSAWTISAQAPDFLRSYAPLSPPSPGTGPRSRDRCGSDRRGTRTTGGPPPRLGRPARPRLRPRGTRRRSGRTKARRTSGT